MNMFSHISPSGPRGWLRLPDVVDRPRYVAYGLGLAALHYATSVLLVQAVAGEWLSPWDFLRIQSTRDISPRADNEIVVGRLLLGLPFLFAGIVLTVKRLADAGHRAWFAALLLLPYVRYLLFAVACVLPSRRRGEDPERRRATEHPETYAARAVAAGVVVAAAAVGIGIQLARSSYGLWLFVLVPVVQGAATAYVYTRARPDDAGRVFSLAMTSLGVAGLVLLALAWEGLICLVMATPIAAPLALVGAVIGRVAGGADAASHRPANPAMLGILLIPLTATMEPATGHAVHEVQTSVVIDASPEQVWPHVIAFSEIPEPSDLAFRAGIAYPVRARIEGTGVGAIRYCEFSTGSFVEPITHWEPGRRLAFDVVSSPAALRELSPYDDISPRHLHGYLRSKRGEFRFVDLGDGRTRLEGSTWYEIEMGPEAYWRVWSDAFIHRIHRRVLEHIKQEVEGVPSRTAR